MRRFVYLWISCGSPFKDAVLTLIKSQTWNICAPTCAEIPSHVFLELEADPGSGGSVWMFYDSWVIKYIIFVDIVTFTLEVDRLQEEPVPLGRVDNGQKSSVLLASTLSIVEAPGSSGVDAESSSDLLWVWCVLLQRYGEVWAGLARGHRSWKRVHRKRMCTGTWNLN